MLPEHAEARLAQFGRRVEIEQGATRLGQGPPGIDQGFGGEEVQPTDDVEARNATQAGANLFVLISGDLEPGHCNPGLAGS
jgi:hypothetical protein